MRVQNLDNSPQVPINLEAFVLHSENTIELIHLTLRPGQKLDEHKNPFDVIFFVIEGEGVLSIEGQPITLKKSDTTKVTSDKNRGWENKWNEDLRLLVIKLL